MIYTEPMRVTAPRDFIEIQEIIYDGGEESVSIARLKWEGEEVYGIRWNVSMNEWNDEQKRNETRTCLGMPISYSHPVWFVLPMNDKRAIEELSKIFNR